MLVSFVKGSPALLINKSRQLVISDLHIGNEFKLARSGIYFPKATERMAEQLLSIYKKTRANGIIMLGDIKESIGYPPKDEADAIASFFHRFREVNLTLIKGNHDAHLGEMLRRIGIGAFPVNELLLDRIAFIHGNTLPSQEAMQKEYIIAGHSHIAIDRDGKAEKGWLVAGIGKGARKKYKKYNRKAKLIVLPAFNGLITGVRVNLQSEWTMPLLRNRIFDPDSAKLYDLQKRLITT